MLSKGKPRGPVAARAAWLSTGSGGMTERSVGEQQSLPPYGLEVDLGFRLRTRALERGCDRHLDYGYALTVHRSQGATYDRSHVLAAGGGRELAYVALSRARERTYIDATGR